MLEFAMDCWLGGGAILLFYQIFYNLKLKGHKLNHGEMFASSLFLGFALFLSTKFIMAVIILWSMWE